MSGRRGAARTALLTVAAMVAFASNSLLCRGALGGRYIDATSFTTLRLAGGAVALALLLRAAGGGARRGRDTGAPGAGGWVSAIALFAYAIGFSLAYTRITAGTGALLLFGAVQLTMLGTGLVSGERPRAAEWLGLAVSAAGLAILTAPGLARPDLPGAFLMLGAGVAWGVYSLRGRRSTAALASNAGNFARAVPLALAASAAAWGVAGWGATGWGAAGPGAAAAGASGLRVSPHGALLALTSGALASGLGYAIWYAALRGLTATRAAIVQLSVPPLAAAGGVLLLGENLTLRLVLGGTAILGGITLAIAAHARGST